MTGAVLLIPGTSGVSVAISAVQFVVEDRTLSLLYPTCAIAGSLAAFRPPTILRRSGKELRWTKVSSSCPRRGCCAACPARHRRHLPPHAWRVRDDPSLLLAWVRSPAAGAAGPAHAAA